MVAPRGRHVSGGWTKVNFAILLHLLLSNNAANADVIMSHQETLDQRNFKQNVNVYHFIQQHNLTTDTRRLDKYLDSVTTWSTDCVPTFCVLKMLDHEEGVAFLPQEDKEKDGVNGSAANEEHGKKGGIPASASLHGNKEVDSQRNFDPDTGKIKIYIED